MQYTKEEGVRLLSDFQDELIRDYRTRFNKSLINRKYFVNDLEATANGFGLAEDAGFCDLKMRLGEMSKVTDDWRGSIFAEERALRALGKTLPGEDMAVLYGVSLPGYRKGSAAVQGAPGSKDYAGSTAMRGKSGSKDYAGSVSHGAPGSKDYAGSVSHGAPGSKDYAGSAAHGKPEGSARTGLDAVVITPYGVFVIEVQSFGRDMVWDEKGFMHPAGAEPVAKSSLPTSQPPVSVAVNGAGSQPPANLGEHIACKELLLRSTLREHMNVPVYSILLAADNRARITDNYGKIPVSSLNTILSDIRSYSDGRRYIQAKEMQELKDFLLGFREPVLKDCPVDCGKIAEEYFAFVSKCNSRDKGLWQKLRDMFGRKPAPETHAEVA